MASSVAASPLDALAREHPEWRPWLALVALARAEAMDHAWDDDIGLVRGGDDEEPRLAGVTLEVVAWRARDWVRRVFFAAGVSAGLAAVARLGADEATAVLEAALDGRPERLSDHAGRLGVPIVALQAVAPLLAMPLLHACRRAAGPGAPAAGPRRAWCPLCGAWPSLAEARGLERSRRLRCARCGGDWEFDWLRCPFCGNGDHTSLGSLVGEASLETRRVETCRACRGYLKTVTTLRPTPPEDLALLDLTTVELDVAALQRGYRRPDGPARPSGARVALTPREGRWWRPW